MIQCWYWCFWQIRNFSHFLRDSPVQCCLRKQFYTKLANKVFRMRERLYVLLYKNRSWNLKETFSEKIFALRTLSILGSKNSGLIGLITWHVITGHDYCRTHLITNQGKIYSFINKTCSCGKKMHLCKSSSSEKVSFRILVFWKIRFFQNIAFLQRCLFRRISFIEKVAVVKNLILYRSTSFQKVEVPPSEQVRPPKNYFQPTW